MKKFFIVTVATLILVGCSKVTKESYDQIEAGMMRSEVEALLGGSGTCDSNFGGESCKWESFSGSSIEVMFMADRVIWAEGENLN